MAVAGGADLVAAGTAAHLASDRVARDRRRNFSVRRAIWESGVSTLVGGACGATLGRGCATGSIARSPFAVSMGAGGLAVGWILKYRG